MTTTETALTPGQIIWQQIGGQALALIGAKGAYTDGNALCFRILEAGLGILPVPDARVVHHYREDPRRADNMAAAEAGRRRGML